jgi:hypothetical protein
MADWISGPGGVWSGDIFARLGEGLGLAPGAAAQAAPWALAAGAAVLLWAVLRLLGRLRRRRRMTREGAARLELRVTAAAAEVEARRRAEARQMGEAFVAELAQALDGGRTVPEAELPTGWLDEMRPVLAEAYGLLAENALAGATTAADLAAARRWASGAVAAGACGAETMLQTIDEAMRERVFDRFAEADLLAWRVARLGPILAARTGADGLPRGSAYRTGAALRLSGWELEELRDAALGALAEEDSADDPAGAGEKANPPESPAAEPAGRTTVVALAARSGAAGDSSAEGVRRLRLGQVGRQAARGPRALRIRANAAWAEGRRGRHAEAERAFEAIAREMAGHPAFGAHHRDTLTVRHNLIWQVAAQGRLDEAERQLRDLLAEMERQAGLPASDRLLLAARHLLADLAGRRGASAEAQVLYGTVVEGWSRAAEPCARRPEALWSRARMLRAASGQRARRGRDARRAGARLA